MIPDLRLAHCQDTQAPSDTADSLITTLMTIPTTNPDPQKSLNTALGKYIDKPEAKSQSKAKIRNPTKGKGNLASTLGTLKSHGPAPP